MAPPILTVNQSLEVLFEQMFFTRVALGADAEAASHAPAFDDFLKKEWQPVAERERQLRCGVLVAMAMVSSIDRRQEGWIDRFHNTLLVSTGNRRDVPQYQRYFGNQPPSQLKRPVLGAQLVTLSAWLPSVKASTEPTIAALAKELESLVGEGEKAEAALLSARAQVKDFREIGARKVLFDSANSLRQSTFGELSALVHDHPEKNLSADWADDFFRHTQRERLSPESERSRLLAEIAELKATLAESEARLSELDAQQAQAQAQAEQRRATEEQLQALEAEAREKNAAAQALRDKLGPPKSRKRKPTPGRR